MVSPEVFSAGVVLVALLLASAPGGKLVKTRRVATARAANMRFLLASNAPVFLKSPYIFSINRIDYSTLIL